MLPAISSCKKIIVLIGFAAITSCNNNSSHTTALNSEASITDSGDNNDSDPYHLRQIKLPQGYTIEVYAAIKSARQMCISPEGTLYVGTKDKNVYAVPDKNHDGKADKVYQIASNLHEPNGVAFKNGNLYIGAISTIYRLDNIENSFASPPAPVTVYDKYPTDEHHGLKFIAFGPDNKLYVPVGAPCNICEPPKPIYASMTRINPDGTGVEIFAKGIRNTVGFDWEPGTGHLWFTDNGRDNLGDDVPNDELNTAPQANMNFGYPYCHQGNIIDPDLGKGKSCSSFTPPVKLLGPHVASLGMRFNKVNKFGATYDGAIFIAEHGSWNRSVPIGYRVAVIQKNGSGDYTEPKVFAEGWLQNVRDVSGRPVDVQFTNEGALLISDDYAGVIYKVSYTGK